MAGQKFVRFCILFFQMKILKKTFFAKTHQEGPKIVFSQKNFFFLNDQKKT